MNRDYAVRIRRHCCSSHSPNSGGDGEATLEYSIAYQFVQSCQAHLARTAVVDAHVELSYHWLLRQAMQIAGHLKHHCDFKTGDHVGLQLGNCPEYVAAFYGIVLAEGVVVPLPVHHKEHQLQKLRQLADIRHTIEPLDSNDDGQTIELNAESLQPKFEPKPVRPSQLAMMLFTSGSSGHPKSVMLSHQNLLANCRSILEYLPIDCNDRALSVMPFCHALGNSVLQTHVLSGAAMVLQQELLFPSVLIDALAKNRCTSLTAVPEMMRSLLLALRGKPLDLPNLRYLSVAGGRLNVPDALELASRIDPAKLYLMYGQTEATARLAYLPPEQLKQYPHTVGQAVPGVELSVRDDAGRQVNHETIGKLYARGSNIMLGYYKDVQSTREVLEGKWLNTGDLARVTKTGQIEICGRADHLVKIQGHRFHPDEITNLLQSHLPELHLVATPFNFLGETRIALFAKQKSELAPSINDIRTFCRQLLPRHMMPQQIELVKNWPLNGSRKIDLKYLQMHLEQRILKSGEQAEQELAIARGV